METLPRPTEARRHIFAYAAFVFVTLIAYWPSMHGTLLWDDEAHITPLLLRSWKGLLAIWIDPNATHQYYPLLHSAFWIEHRIWGDSFFGYHLVNVALHACSAYLLVSILKKLEIPGATLAGWIFALHPICVEGVAWISEQKSTLSGAFYFASAWNYVLFDSTRGRRRYVKAFLFFSCALMCKSVTATLAPALLLILWWKRGRLDWRRDILPLAPWFLVGTTAGLFTAWVERHLIGAQGAEFHLSFLQRFLIAGRVVWFYLAKALWPIDLTFIYRHWTIDTHVWWQYLYPLALIASLVTLAFLARKSRAPLACALYFVGTLFPVLGFLNVYPFLYSYVADHFQYLACIGIIVPFAAVVSTFGSQVSVGRLSRFIQFLVLICLGVLTWRQSRMYRDVETLYRITLKRNPDCWMAHVNLGHELSSSQGGTPEALYHFREALRLHPDAVTHNDLGSLLARSPQTANLAVAEFREAIRLQPSLSNAHLNLGNMFLVARQSTNAMAEYREALRWDPRSVEARINLASLLIQIPQGRLDGVLEYRKAVRLAPDSCRAHFGLAIGLSLIPGQEEEMLSEFDAAVRCKPSDPFFHLAFGDELAKLPGRQEDAIRQYEAALKIRPDLPEAHVSIGNLLIGSPAGLDEAIDEYNAALRLNQSLAAAHVGLGSALAEKPGKLAEARSHAEEALKLQPDLEPARRLNEQLRMRHN